MRVIDTYWSDHCRHTTFTTAIDEVKIEQGYFSPALEKAYGLYQQDRTDIYRDEERPVTLMDLAVIGMKALRRAGKLDDKRARVIRDRARATTHDLPVRAGACHELNGHVLQQVSQLGVAHRCGIR